MKTEKPKAFSSLFAYIPKQQLIENMEGNLKKERESAYITKHKIEKMEGNLKVAKDAFKLTQRISNKEQKKRWTVDFRIEKNPGNPDVSTICSAGTS